MPLMMNPDRQAVNDRTRSPRFSPDPEIGRLAAGL
jgi:hypothetical protein